MKTFVTSFDKGHSHYWMATEKRTSLDDGHSHIIDLKKNIATSSGTGHTHKLL